MIPRDLIYWLCFFLASVPLPRDTARAMTENEFRDFKTEMFEILDEVVPAVEAFANANKFDISSLNLGNYS